MVLYVYLINSEHFIVNYYRFSKNVCDVTLTIKPAEQIWIETRFDDVIWHVAVLEDLPDHHNDEWNTPSVNEIIEELFAQDGFVC